MKKVELDSIVKRNNTIVTSSIDNDIVMISIERGKYYSMESIGSRIWELMNEELTVKDLCDKLCNKYNVDVEQCQSDVLHLLKDLVNENLIIIQEK